MSSSLKFVGQRSFIMFFLCLAACLATGLANQINVVNNCPFTIWPGVLGNAGKAQPENRGFQLDSGSNRTITVPDDSAGRLWGRTNCNDIGKCETGDCGNTIECNGAGGVPPVPLAKMILAGYGRLDYYYVSLVDGYNLPIEMRPQVIRWTI